MSVHDDRGRLMEPLLLCTETGLSLARICCLAQAQDASHIDISLRQSAGVNLKKYTRERWSIAFPTFIGDPPGLEVRTASRGISKLTTRCGHTELIFVRSTVHASATPD